MRRAVEIEGLKQKRSGPGHETLFEILGHEIRRVRGDDLRRISVNLETCFVIQFILPAIPPPVHVDPCAFDGMRFCREWYELNDMDIP